MTYDCVKFAELCVIFLNTTFNIPDGESMNEDS